MPSARSASVSRRASTCACWASPEAARRGAAARRRGRAGADPLDGRDLLTLPRDQLRRQPWTCLNPTLPVASRGAARATLELMRTGRQSPRYRRRYRRYPHELSGGMAQRVIAIAWPSPRAPDRRRAHHRLDVTVQAGSSTSSRTCFTQQDAARSPTAPLHRHAYAPSARTPARCPSSPTCRRAAASPHAAPTRPTAAAHGTPLFEDGVRCWLWNR